MRSWIYILGVTKRWDWSNISILFIFIFIYLFIYYSQIQDIRVDIQDVISKYPTFFVTSCAYVCVCMSTIRVGMITLDFLDTPTSIKRSLHSHIKNIISFIKKEWNFSLQADRCFEQDSRTYPGIERPFEDKHKWYSIKMMRNICLTHAVSSSCRSYFSSQYSNSIIVRTILIGRSIRFDVYHSSTGPLMNQLMNSDPIRTYKDKQHWLRAMLGRVVPFDWSAKAPSVWWRVISVNLYHCQMVDFANKLSIYQSGEAIPSLEDQNSDGISPEYP